MTERSASQEFFDLWKKQVEEGTQTWARMVGQTQTADPTQFWRPFMDQGMAAWATLLTQGPVTPNLLPQWKQFLDQWIGAWARVLEQAMGTEAFAQALGGYLERWLSLQVPIKKVAEESTEATLSALGIPSRSQLTGIARQIVDLDDRVERLEERLNTLMMRLDEVLKTKSDAKRIEARRARRRAQ
jgi:hypothetical protein